MKHFSLIAVILMLFCACSSGSRSFVINDVGYNAEASDPQIGRCLEIQVSYTAKGYAGQDLIVAMAFADENGNPLIDIDDEWNILGQKGGQVGMQGPFHVEQNNETAVMTLKFPIKELQIKGTKPVQLAFALIIATSEHGEVTEDTIICSTDGYRFTAKK